MVTMRCLCCEILVISICLLHLCTVCEGRPLRRRSVSEVQLMHNLREHKQVQDRRDWLQTRLRDIHTASARGSGDSSQREREREREREIKRKREGD
uniref:Parathyroid hormone n=1 Tax=Myripristis murdjan TaxID=586833 RepID=A0A667ZLY6_9TELE